MYESTYLALFFKCFRTHLCIHKFNLLYFAVDIIYPILRSGSQLVLKTILIKNKQNKNETNILTL